MICTEAEAVTKWCPMTRVAFMGSYANRISSERLQAARAEADRTGDDRDWKYYIQQMKDTHCIGSLCMMWRWAGYKRIPNGNDEAHGCCALANHSIPTKAIVREMDGTS